ncbi:MAG: hypothetical protein GY757_45880, partial [bacterium]|nr:hypothetical protein [bacterium]
RNSKQLYIPASAIKVFMSAVSLIKFGPDYRFKTPLKTDGQVHNRLLEGNLFLEGKGDPALMSSHLKEATEALKAQGIDIIKGDIVYDESFLDSEEPRYAPNARHYYAPPGAITVNYNWLDTKLEDGPPPLLKTIPQTAYAQLDYKITVSASSRPGRPKMTYKRMPWGDLYSIKGKVTGWDKKYKYLQLCVTRPGLYGATLLKEACEAVGIKIEGKIRIGIVPEGAKLLHSIKTDQLKLIITNL